MLVADMDAVLRRAARMASGPFVGASERKRAIWAIADMMIEAKVQCLRPVTTTSRQVTG